MTLKFLTEELNYFTGKISEETVKLNYAGIAMVWMFKPATGWHGLHTAAIVLYVLSLTGYMVFLLYSARKLDQTFAEQERIIDSDDRIPADQKETYDFGGWDKGITEKKKWLRRIYLILCFSGYVIFGISLL